MDISLLVVSLSKPLDKVLQKKNNYLYRSQRERLLYVFNSLFVKFSPRFFCTNEAIVDLFGFLFSTANDAWNELIKQYSFV